MAGDMQPLSQTSSLVRQHVFCDLQIRRTIAAPHIKKDFAGLLAGSEGERKKIVQLADLLERMMALDPDKRITPKDALKHPFIKEAK